MTTQVFHLNFKDGKRCTCIAMERLSEKEVFKMNLPVIDTEKARFERVVIECARGLIKRGDVLSPKDAERLELAVQRLDDWS